jgi:ribosomal protein S18 acetylase RimI-like enzyme
MLRLDSMDEEAFRASLARRIANHAAESVRRAVWTEADADRATMADFEERLPQGRMTPGFQFRSVFDEKTGSRVGETWFDVREKGGKVQFWIDWLWIEPTFRRRGFATAVIHLLEEEAVKAGADRIGLHVLAENTGAAALYSRLGLVPDGLILTKPLARRGRDRTGLEGPTGLG